MSRFVDKTFHYVNTKLWAACRGTSPSLRYASENMMRLTSLDNNITDSKILRRVLFGLHPSIKIVCPNPLPSTLDQLFIFVEKLHTPLPANDPYWGSTTPARRVTVRDASQDREPDLSIVVPNRAHGRPTPNTLCYKWGDRGHFALQCKKKEA